MLETAFPTLLTADEPAPFALENPGGDSSIVLVCEHGGRRIPKRLGTLGLAPEHLAKHFMWDPGALDLARALALLLNAPLAHQLYSRMVCDCNRQPDAPDFIPDHGEGIPVPGNKGLDDRAFAQRLDEVWKPFHGAVAALLDRRRDQGLATLLVTVHSFTPVFYGRSRPWHLGVLFDRDERFSPLLHRILRNRLGEIAAANEPYEMSRATDYTVPVHGEDRGLDCVEFEVRNDLIADEAGVAAWAECLVAALRQACDEMGAPQRA